MSADATESIVSRVPEKPSWQDLLALAHVILQYANIRVPRPAFLFQLSRVILAATGSDRVDLSRMKDGAFRFHCSISVIHGEEPVFESRSFGPEASDQRQALQGDEAGLEAVRRRVLAWEAHAGGDEFTRAGSFWSNRAAAGGIAWGSIAIIRFRLEEGNFGLLELRSRRPDFFTLARIEFFECVAQFIGIAVADRRARSTLRRRVSELTCLNEIARIEQQGIPSLPEVLQRIVALLPKAFAVGETQALIRLDDRDHVSDGFDPGRVVLGSDLEVGGTPRGRVEIAGEALLPDLDVHYSPEKDQRLLDTLTRQISLLVERREARRDRSELENQLRHADRLATIGQLAAGVAHELNEPLGNILGFAQLVAKGDALPDQTRHDVDKIVNAALRGREIVRKLLIFARQMPTRMQAVDLNEIVEDGLSLLESRCAKEGIEPIRLLAPDLPRIHADAGQLQQVLVNLVVNAIQATGPGGRIFIETSAAADRVTLSVQDTGTGVDEAVRERIFLPFFTTKDVGQGTGLGLAVVHGIVSAHGGTIAVESEVGKGTRFDIVLPLRPPDVVLEES